MIMIIINHTWYKIIDDRKTIIYVMLYHRLSCVRKISGCITRTVALKATFVDGAAIEENQAGPYFFRG